MEKINIKRGDILIVDLSPVIGSEQGGNRPVVVVQNNVGNKFSPTIIVASITAKMEKNKLPTHVEIEESFGLNKTSIILLEQLRTVDKSRIRRKIGKISKESMKLVDRALLLSVGLTADSNKEYKKLEKNLKKIDNDNKL